MAVVRLKAERPEPEKEKTHKGRVIRVRSKQETWDFFYEQGFIDGNTIPANKTGFINNCWKDEPAYIIGAGPPLKTFIELNGWRFFDGKHTIGINHIIEDYDRLEWHFFLDKRLINLTKYVDGNDFTERCIQFRSKFRGHIFAQNNTGVKPAENVTLFKCRTDRPGNTFDEGLYSPNFSGLAALNLALLTGANPIYLIGFGMGVNATHKNYHHKKDYTGETKNKSRFNKYKNVQKFYNRFKAYKKRIIHVTNGNDMPVFNKMKVKRMKGGVKIKSNQPKIVHLSFTNKIDKMGDISREIISNCYGRHSLHNIKTGKIPAADLYIFEHFLSTDMESKKFPYKHKAIDLIHTVHCIPTQGYKKKVVITRAWQNRLSKYGKNCVLIKGGIDLKPYENIKVDYSRQVFGRITRWSPGKIPPDWNRIVTEILDIIPKSECLFYVDFVATGNRKPLKHPRMIYDETVKINMFKGDYLKNMSLYVHANGTFKETMSHAVIEAMATGLPVIYKSEGTGVLKEVTGSAGIACKTMQQVKIAIIEMLRNEDMRIEFGKRAKQQARKWNVENTIIKWNSLIRECLK
jgi:glycosyltransferase involved in cell wall biosynthesis